MLIYLQRRSQENYLSTRPIAAVYKHKKPLSSKQKKSPICAMALAISVRGQTGEETLDNRGISEEDIVKMTDSNLKDTAVPGGDAPKASSAQQTEEEKKLMEEWEQHMHDFVPEDITTIVIDPRKEVTFYEDIDQENVYVRGAYFVGQSSTSNKLIDFFIVNPKNKVIFSRRKMEEGIFRFNTTMPGRYSFIFSNIKDRKSIKDVTIAIHTPGPGEDVQDTTPTPVASVDAANITAEMARDQDIDSIQPYNICQSLKVVFADVRSLFSEAKMSFIRQDGVNQMVEDNSNYNFYATLIESAVFVAIAAAQVFYIRNMLETKRII